MRTGATRIRDRVHQVQDEPGAALFGRRAPSRPPARRAGRGRARARRRGRGGGGAGGDEERKKLYAIEDVKAFYAAATEFLKKNELPDDARLLDRLPRHPHAPTLAKD